MRNAKILGIIILIVALVSGCTKAGLNNPGDTPLGSTLAQLDSDISKGHKSEKASKPPAAILKSLIAEPEPLTETVSSTQEHFDVSANDVPAQEFFLSLVKGTPYNIVVSPKIEGSITLHLNDVTIEQVLTAIKKSYGYQYHKEPYGFYVYPDGLQTRIFAVHYLDVQRSGNSHVSIESGLINQQENQTTSAGGQTQTSTQNVRMPSSSLSSSSKVNFWEDLQQSLETIVKRTEGSKVVLNPSTGLVVVTANREQLDRVAEYLDDLNHVTTKQILIQAEVMSVTLNKGFQAGIDWSLLGASQAGTAGLADTSIFALTGRAGSLKATINLLSTQGNVQVLSSPRVSALNNQKAMIKIGGDRYFVTNVSSTVSGSGDDSQATQSIDMEPFFSGVSLSVTPTVIGGDQIMMEIHPIVSEVDDDEKKVTIDGKQTNIPSAKSETDETDSIIFARSGEVIALSGLIKDSTEEQLRSTPFLGSIPFVGSLFRQTIQNSVRSELVILIRPMIVDNHKRVETLEQARSGLKDVQRGYHVGGFAQRFGNQGEMQGVKNLPFTAPDKETDSTHNQGKTNVS